MGSCKFIAAKWVQALKCNQSFWYQQLSMYWIAEQNYVGRSTEEMPDLIWLLAGIKSQANAMSSLKILCDWKEREVTKSFILQGKFSSRHLKFFSIQVSDVSCIFLSFCVLPSKRGCSMQTDLQKPLIGLKYGYANSEMFPMHRNWKRSELLKRMMRLGPAQCWELKMFLGC